MVETILQHWIFTRFAFPFLLLFFVVFAILEKTKIFGEGKKQLNALVAFIIGLVFVSVAYPVDVVTNLILFLTVALITMFIALLLWGFVGGEAKIDNKPVKIILGVVIAIAVIGAILWAAGWYTPLTDWLFKQEWSGPFWTNLLFVVVIVVAIVLILKGKSE
jgi:hypothetical protein